jgi:hypothetical protein
MAHFAAALIPLPLGGMSPSKIARTEFSSEAMGDVVPLISPCCLSHEYAAEALLACLWQLGQVFEKPSVVQIEDHVGAVPVAGGHPVLASPLKFMKTEPPLELELPFPDEAPLLLPLLEPKPKPALEPPELLLANPEPRSKPPLLLELEPLPVSPTPEPMKPPPLLLEPEPVPGSPPVAVLGSVGPASIPSK